MIDNAGLHTHRKRSRAAFTLLELIIVLAIVTLMTTLALTKFDINRLRADAASGVVRGALQIAQRTAVLKQYDVIVSFDVAGGAIRVAEDSNANRSVDTGERVTWRRLEEGARFAAPPTGISGLTGGAIRGTTIRDVGGYPSITFHRDGAASSDLEIYLTTARGQPRDARAITLVQSTSRTDWFRYQGLVWVSGAL